MTVLIKLCYAFALTALFILLVAFGIRTFYAPPEEPRFPQASIAFRPVAPVPAGEPQPDLTPEQREYEQQQIEYQQAYERYQEARADYRRNVFVIAAVLGIAAIAGGVALQPRFDAIRLGLAGGGLGTLIYAVIQAGGDLDDAGPAVIFVVTAIGLVLVGYAGYRWLATRPDEPTTVG